MLGEERKKLIIDTINSQGALSLQEIMQLCQSSEATVRRDLTQLHQQGLLVKVHGGAVAVDSHITQDYRLEEREMVNPQEKREIARYAASLIKEKSMVYLDAGTTTYLMIEFLDQSVCKDAVFVTNGIAQAKSLAEAGYTVYLTGGKLKATTGALVGADCYSDIEKYNFTIGFFGTNAVRRKNGCTTPDPEEAEIKRIAIQHTKQPYVLADQSKFGKTSSVSFAQFKDVQLITDRGVSNQYQQEDNVIVPGKAVRD